VPGAPAGSLPRPGRRRLGLRYAALGILALALAVGIWAVPRAARFVSLVAGLHAGHACSGAFVAGRPLDAIVRGELSGLHWILDALPLPPPILERDARLAAVDPPLGLVPRRAVWRGRCGCTLLPPGAAPSAVEDLPCRAPPPPPGDPSAILWPAGDRLPEAPVPTGVDPEALAAAVDAAFAGPARTLGVVVVYRDRIVAERYAPGWDAHTAYRTWSTAKSLTGALVGVLVGRGDLALEAPAPIPEWSAPDDPRRAITLDHLLRMSSGLASEGAFTPELYWGGVDTAARIVRAELEAEPGSRWRYANQDTLLLVRAMKAVLGPDAYAAFPWEALLHPVGMRHTVPETDPHGNFILSSQVYTTPRDLARFGLLHLHDGVWEGRRILPEGWVEHATTPAPASRRLPPDHRAHAGYGAQLWLYGRDPRLPADAFSTAGARGQHATVVPSRHAVVVRTGLDPLAEDPVWDQRGFVASVLAALPE